MLGHPGHELLIYGWLRKTSARVCVLTDGSGASLGSRLDSTEAILRTIGAPAGPIFGRLTDLEAYAAILGRDTALITSIAQELADRLAGTSVVVADACEGYNPVHDLCRLIAGSACAVTGIPYYEYPVTQAPSSFTDVRVDLDEPLFREKIAAARAYARLWRNISRVSARTRSASRRSGALRTGPRSNGRPARNRITKRSASSASPQAATIA